MEMRENQSIITSQVWVTLTRDDATDDRVGCPEMWAVDSGAKPDEIQDAWDGI